MRPQGIVWVLSVSLPGICFLMGCSGFLRQPTLTYEQRTLRIPLSVDRDGVATLAEPQPLLGRIALGAILQAEGMSPGPPPPANLQLLGHYGRFFVAADGFRSIWEITPKPATSRASYRPIVIVADPQAPGLSGVRLSSYGTSESPCLRIDVSDGRTFFVSRESELHASCP